MFGSVVNFGTSELLWLSSNNFFCEVAILEAIFVSKKIYKVATIDGSPFWNLENDLSLWSRGCHSNEEHLDGDSEQILSSQKLFRFYTLLFVQFPSTTVDGSEIPNNHRLDV